MHSGVHIADEAVERFISDGFVSLKIPNPMQDYLRTLFCVGRDFFNVGVEEKLLNRLRLDTGYRPKGIEYSDTPDHPDEMESFSVTRRLPNAVASLRSARAKILYLRMSEFIGLLEPYAERLITAVAMKLTGTLLNQDMDGAFSKWSLLQMNYSRPADIRADYINDCHEDGCLITITAVTGPGLELQSTDGSFVQVSPKDDELLLMSGEILSLLSGGKIPPTYHRVRPIAQNTERLSLLFFGDIDPALCKPWIVNDTNANIDIGDRVLNNSTRFGLARWDLE
jgi:isopenicillin N synthase-like dioxygenase